MLAVGAGAAIFKALIDQGGAAVEATKVVEAAIKTTGGAAQVARRADREDGRRAGPARRA